MANYQLTKKAEQDLASILSYSLKNFGENQADHYLEELQNTFIFLAENPGLGVDCGFLKEGARSHAHGRHIIYFTQSRQGIKILRILHGAMKPPQQK